MAEEADDGAEVGATAAASAGAGDRLGTGDPPGPGLPETARTARARRPGARSTGRMRGGVRRRRPRAAGWEGIRELTAILESSGRRGGLGSGSEGQGSTAAGGGSLFASPLFLGNRRTPDGRGRPRPVRERRGCWDRTPVPPYTPYLS